MKTPKPSAPLSPAAAKLHQLTTGLGRRHDDPSTPELAVKYFETMGRETLVQQTVRAAFEWRVWYYPEGTFEFLSPSAAQMSGSVHFAALLSRFRAERALSGADTPDAFDPVITTRADFLAAFGEFSTFLVALGLIRESAVDTFVREVSALIGSDPDTDAVRRTNARLGGNSLAAAMNADLATALVNDAAAHEAGKAAGSAAAPETPLL